MVRAVAGGIDAYEEDADSGSPRGTVTRDTRRVERTLIVKEDVADEPTQDAINALVDECFPLFQPPGRLPVAGSLLFVDSLDFEPFGKSVGLVDELGTYKAWKAKLVYTPLPYKTPDEDESAPPNALDLLEQSWQGGGEFMTLPGSSMYWQDEAVPIGDEIPVAKRILFIQHAHTRHHLERAQIPYNEMKALAGKVNSTDFSGSHPIFPGVKAETLLFESFNLGYRYASNGDNDFRLTLNFKERTETHQSVKITWNHFWNRKEQKFVRAYFDSAHTKKPYETAPNADFDELFGI